VAEEARLPVTDFDGPPPSSGLTRQQWGLLIASDQIKLEQPDRLQFSHSVLCQVGMPRKSTPLRSFERTNGNLSLLVEAGKLWNGLSWTEQPLPYGAIPRLVMVHVSTEAVRTRSRVIDIGESMRQYLLQLGLQVSGGPRGGYTALRRQLQALAACRMTLGMTNARAVGGLLRHSHTARRAARLPRARGPQALSTCTRHLHMARAPFAAGTGPPGHEGELEQSEGSVRAGLWEVQGLQEVVPARAEAGVPRVSRREPSRCTRRTPAQAIARPCAPHPDPHREQQH